ncbi:MAG: EAL domain-containing protein [Gammaproteobacteria bacterium]|nr:EAL domain-containing protein [Gammaproteobacteria bacterium]
MLTVLVLNSMRTMESSLLQLSSFRMEEVKHLINTALAPPLVQRDYASLQEIMDKSRSSDGIVYLVLFDETNKPIVSSGIALDAKFPPIDKNILQTLDHDDHVFNGDVPISFAGMRYGHLRFGLTTDFLYKARRQLLQQSILIAGSEVLLSIVILAAIGIWLMRHLSELGRISDEVRTGNYDVRAPVRGDDEIGRLASTFNNMIAAIHNQVAELSSNEAKFHAIADYTYNWESWYSADQELIWLNPSVERMTGYTVVECAAMDDFPFSIVHPEDRAHARLDYAIHKRGSTGTAHFRLVRKDGSVFWAEAAWQPIYDQHDKYMGIRSSIRDVSEQMLAERHLQEKVRQLHDSEEKQRQLLNHSQQEQARMVALLGAMKLGILFETSDGRVAYYNPAFTHIWMIPKEKDLTGLKSNEVLAHSSNVLAQPDNFSKHILNVPGTHEVSESLEVHLADSRVITQLCYPVRDAEGRALGQLWIYEDVTRERQTAEQLLYLAERDPLTGLYNRRRFEEELGRAMASAARRKSTGALLFFDLDEFKYINDTYGHRTGDAMLIKVGHEVSALTRSAEILSRLGGDEFAILIPDATQEQAEKLAERVIRSIYQIPFRFDGRNLRLTTSVGIAMYPLHAAEQDELIAHADAAMYQAKEAGKNVWRLYRSDLDTSHQMIDRLSWVNRIAQALEQDQFVIHFQGIYNTYNGQLEHIELLVRMLDEETSSDIIMPGRFIPFAEKSGQILEIDRWVIRRGLERLANDSDFPDVPISINISGRSLDDPSLTQYIQAQLQRYKINPDRLLFEITETSAISDLHDAQRFIESLQLSGCRVCLDDFGAGFSSFTYLKHLKADILKIDGQFIRDLPIDEDNQIFVKAIANVAQGMEKYTVAEFVEDEKTLWMLREMGIDMVQGYHLHQPNVEPPPVNSSTIKKIWYGNEKS